MIVLSQLSEDPSSSSSTHDYRYDVFLSFRGLDTRLSFTDHLHKALLEANIKTFLDEEEIETGLYLKPELETAIKSSRASIIVLSENYASSTWCLNELVFILDQHRNSGQIVIPIFYHVEPTNIRKQQSSFGDAMAKHKQRMEVETNVQEKSQLVQNIEIWKKALIKVADLKGKEAKGRLETEFIEEIVKDIYHRLGLHLRSAQPLLIGMDYSIKFITSWLKDGSTRTVNILTIFGMGGIGKTSLAKYVYGSHHHVFDKSSFIQDISRRCKERFNGILDLQKQLCGDFSKRSLIQVHDVSVYTSMIENTLARKKVFLVLDDINSLKQLDALLGSKDFHPGSKVIITTKDVSLIESCALFNLKVPPQHTKHLLQGLHRTESLQLLCIHAFMCNNPKEGYEKVSNDLVKYCDGHPLALEVLGRFLRNRDVAYWEEHIKGLKKETDSHVNYVLRMSFDDLASENDKELFKHIACFFVGEDRKFSETILKACGIRTLHGITNLIDRCLLMIGPRNELQMHQLLQEMGRDVVRQESPDKPEERSRLWCHEESFSVLEQNKGTGKLKGLALDMEILEKEKLCGSVELKTDALSKMDNLMLLLLNYVQLNGSYVNFPQKLRWLCMRGFPLKSIPSKLPMENLVALDMSYSNFESFDLSCSNQQKLRKRQKLTGSHSKEKRLLRSLKILNLSFCMQLSSIGGFFELPALERLILANCKGLIDICESIEQCDELVLLDLSYCNMLKKLPRTMVKLKNIETLLLDGWNLGEFPTMTRDMDLPIMLKDNNIGKKSQTSSSNIVEAIPRDFRSSAISLPSSLVCLSLKDNNLSNESFPMDFSCLSMLKELYLDGNSIISLPNCVRSLPRLEKLSMEKCLMLKTFEHPPRTLKHLTFDYWHSLQKILFDREMSPLMLRMNSHWPPYSGLVVEGIFKTEAMAHVAEEVLCSLSWTNLEFIKKQHVEAKDLMTGTQYSQVQMFYELGIFSTVYEGMEIPNWISHRSNGSSISFTMPSSRNKLTGLNFCHVFTNPHTNYSLLGTDHLKLSSIRICNMTKNRTWIYNRYNYFVTSNPKCVIFLSHWMLGKNEMEDGDQVTITISTLKEYYRSWNQKDVGGISIRECGVSFVYDDGKLEEDPLGYYKSWNHIIGGDLSAFQTTTGEYMLDGRRFFGWLGIYCPFFEGNSYYVEEQVSFRTFS